MSDLIKISGGMSIKDQDRKERLDALAIYVAPLPWFNIDLLHKLYINIFEKYFNQELVGQHTFETRSITCADILNSAEVIRIDYNAFELNKNKRELLRKEINKKKKVLKEIGQFMIAYSESNHHHFLSPRYREVLNIEGRIIIDPRSAASEISFHISNQLNQVQDADNTVKTAEYYLNIIDKTSNDKGIRELKKFLEGTKEWAKGNTEGALKKFIGLKDGTGASAKTITVKLPQAIQQKIKANFERLSKQAVFDRMARGICTVNVKSIAGFGNGILLNGGFLLAGNHLIDSKDDAENTTIKFKGQIREGDSTIRLDYQLDPTGFFLTMAHDNLDFTIVKIKDYPARTSSHLPVPVLTEKIFLRDKYLITKETVFSAQISTEGLPIFGEGSIIDVSEARVYHNITLDFGAGGAPIFDRDGEILGMTVSSNRAKGGDRVEAIRIDRIRAELKALGMDIDNLDAQVKSTDLHCILVGNDEYHDKSIMPLRGAVNDARRMRHFIQSNLSFASLKMIQNASKQEIVETFDRVRKDLKDGDTLLFYFAGYGGREEGHFEKSTKFIATKDDLPGQKETNRLSHFELQHLYQQCFEKEIQIVSILDCGYKADDGRVGDGKTTSFRSIHGLQQGRSRDSMIYDESFVPGEVHRHNLTSFVLTKEHEDVIERVTGGKFLDRFLNIQAAKNLLHIKDKDFKRGEISLLDFRDSFNRINVGDPSTSLTLAIHSYPDDNLDAVLFEKQFLFGNQLVERRMKYAEDRDELDLSGLGLKEVPQNIFRLKKLRHIDLSFNEIEGGFSRLLANKDENISWDRAFNRLDRIRILNVENNPILRIEELALLVMICKEVKYSDENLDGDEKSFLTYLKSVVPVILKKVMAKNYDGFENILNKISEVRNSELILDMIQNKTLSVQELVKLFSLIFEAYESSPRGLMLILLEAILKLGKDKPQQQTAEEQEESIDNVDIAKLGETLALLYPNEDAARTFLTTLNSIIDPAIVNFPGDIYSKWINILKDASVLKDGISQIVNKAYLEYPENKYLVSIIDQYREEVSTAEEQKIDVEGLKKLVAENKIEDVLGQLSKLGKGQTVDYRESVAVLQSNYNKLEQNYQLGLTSQRDQILDRNKFIYSLIEFIDRIDPERSKPKSQVSDETIDWKTAIAELQDHIANANMDTSLEQLSLLSNYLSKDLQNDILVLQTHYAELQKSQRLGIISSTDYDLEINKFISSTLDLIQEIEVEKDINKSRQSKGKSHSQTSVKELHELVAKNRLGEALSKLSELVENQTEEFRTEIRTVEISHNELRRSRRLGIISDQDYTVRLSKITMSILNLIEDINPDQDDTGTQSRKENISVQIDAKKLKQLIAQGKLDQALTELADLLNDQPADIYNSVLILQANFNQLKGGQIRGLLADEDVNRTKNNIARSTLQLIDNLETREDIPKAQRTTPQDKSTANTRELRELVANDKMDEVISALLSLSENQSTDFQNTLLLIQAQTNRLEKNERQGLISAQNAIREKNKIRLAILDLIQSISES